MYGVDCKDEEEEVMEIYLAGKLHGQKTKIFTRLDSEKLHFIASDIDEDDHDWMKDISKIHWEVKDALISKLDSCNLLVAYLDSADSYGSIAEIAYASALGKECFVFIERNGEKEKYYGDIPVQYIHEGISPECIDAYYLVCNFPNVFAKAVDNIDEAIEIVKKITSYESPIEKLFLKFIITNGLLPIIEPQFVIDKYRADFAIPNHKIIIELDGHEFHNTKEQRGKDSERDRDLLQLGWTTIRFTGTEVYSNPQKCIDSLRAILKNKEEKNGELLR